ncbi:hypothetical protein BGZ83_011327 [Gryganskiella cystojenkinii]|nr:hypothetical protein BGZ83_011327 [Gryganskiella cystojenkinii]
MPDSQSGHSRAPSQNHGQTQNTSQVQTQATPSGSAAVLQNVKPSTSSGLPTEDVEDRLDEINELYDVYQIPDQGRCADSNMLLRGNARKWYRRLQPVIDPDLRSTQFQEQIKIRFGSSNSKIFARQNIYKLEQKGSAYQNLQSKIDDFSKSEAIQVCIQGLKPKIQEHFAGNLSPRETLSELMKIAESLNSVLHNNKTVAFTQKSYQPKAVKIPGLWT